MITLFHSRFSVFHLVMIIFFLFAWSRALQQYQQRLMSGFGLAFWTIIWGLASYLIYLPDLASRFAQVLGVQSGANAVFTITTVILFYLAYRMYVKVEHLQRELNKLNQAASIAHDQVSKPSRATKK